MKIYRMLFRNGSVGLPFCQPVTKLKNVFKVLNVTKCTVCFIWTETLIFFEKKNVKISLQTFFGTLIPDSKPATYFSIDFSYVLETRGNFVHWHQHKLSDCTVSIRRQ